MAKKVAEVFETQHRLMCYSHDHKGCISEDTCCKGAQSPFLCKL